MMRERVIICAVHHHCLGGLAVVVIPLSAISRN